MDRFPQEGWAEKEWDEKKEMEARAENENWEIDWELYWENREEVASEWSEK